MGLVYRSMQIRGTGSNPILCRAPVPGLTVQLEQAGHLKDLMPATTSIVLGQFFGVPCQNPIHCFSNGCPTVTSQVVSCLLESDRDYCVAPRDSVVNEVVEDPLSIEGLCGELFQAGQCYRFLAEAVQRVLDLIRGRNQGTLSPSATISTPEVVLLNEMVNQIVSQEHKLLDAALGLSEVIR